MKKDQIKDDIKSLNKKFKNTSINDIFTFLDKTFKKSDVRILHKSDRVPPPPLAYSKKIPLEDRKKIQKAVLEAHKHGKIGGYGGQMSHYVLVKDSDYDVLRNVVKLLNKK